MESKVQSVRGGTNGFASWAGLYVSGVLLFVLALAHIGAVHYATDLPAEGLTFASSTERMESPLYRLVLLGLLLTGLFHGLVGVHRFIADLGICGRRTLRAIAAVLAAAGTAGLAYGWFVYRAFMT